MQRAARHTACYKCRERKVGCDGEQPCSRCERHGQTCTYPNNMKGKQSNNPDLMHYLQSMNERLKQAEEQLAMQHTQNPSIDVTTLNEGALLDTDPTFWDSFSVPSSTNASGSLVLDPIFDTNDFDGMMPLDFSPDFQMNMMPLESTAAMAPGVYSQEIMKLHEIYDNTFHQAFPMISRTRFMKQLSAGQQTEESLSLSYAICAQAALLSPDLSHLKEGYYRLARQSLEKAELEGSGSNLLGFDALQALILIAFYELRHGFIPRAGLSAAKAMRLIQMLELHRMDSGRLTSPEQHLQQNSLGQDWLVQEERRRTFWAAYQVDCLASVFLGGCMPIDEKEITTFLPTQEPSPAGGEMLSRGISLQSAFKENDMSFLSPFAASCVMVTLFRRALVNLRSCRSDPGNSVSYDFWNSQRSLEEALVQTTTALGLTDGVTAGSDPNLLFIGFLNQTILMCLHKAAADRATGTKLPPAMVMESEKTCTHSAIDLAALIKSCTRSDPFPLPAHKYNPFVMLCGYASSQRLAQSINDSKACGETLQALEVLLHFLDHPERKHSSSSMELLASRLLDNFQVCG